MKKRGSSVRGSSAPPSTKRAAPQRRAPHVLVIGGGIMGTSSALALARRGATVTVLEKSVPGAEASSAAAGILGAQAECRAPGPLFDLCQASLGLYPSWCAALQKETGIDVGFRPGGVLELATSTQELRALERDFSWQRERKLRVEPLNKTALRGVEPHLSHDLNGGVLLAGDARVTPQLLYRATHIAASKRGVQFRTGAHVRELAVTDSKVTGARMDDGQVLDADVVVLAAGSWTSLVAGSGLPERAVIPARGQIVELESPEPLLSRVVFGAGCYLVPRDDGRVLIGSTLEFVGYRRDVTAQGVRDLLDSALRLVPRLAEASLKNTWCNFRPYTRDQLPLLGRGPLEGLVVASGHYRNGILLTPITAHVVAQQVLGGRAPLPLAPYDPTRALTDTPALP